MNLPCIFPLCPIHMAPLVAGPPIYFRTWFVKNRVSRYLKVPNHSTKHNYHLLHATQFFLVNSSIHSSHHIYQIHLLFRIPDGFCIGSHANRLGDGTRNPTIFSVSQAFKENLSDTCSVTMNTATPSTLSSIHYTYSLFAATSLFTPAFATDRVSRPP